MKIISANNSNKFEFTAKDWVNIKIAQGQSDGINVGISNVSEPVADPYDEWLTDLSNLRAIKEQINEESEVVSHHERNPESPWGTKEVSDGKAIIKTFTGSLSGEIRIFSNLWEDKEGPKTALEKSLQEAITNYGKIGVIPAINDELDELWVDRDANPKLYNVEVTITSFDYVEENKYQVSFNIEYSTVGYLSNSEIKSRSEDARGEDVF